MAIIKLMHMKEAKGAKNKAAHLKNSIEYILNPQKTQQGLFVGSINCMKSTAYKEMINLKKQYDKEDLRQGYHFVISFAPSDKVTPELAYEITEKMINKYLEEYQSIFAVHDDKHHLHSHIVFNSVSIITGLKYHYQNGEWEREIQPILNDLCEEYQLSVINLENLKENVPKGKNYSRWNIENDIKEIASCVDTLKDLLYFLEQKGYQVKQGKYISLKPQGKKKFIRFSKEKLWEEILKSQGETKIRASPNIKKGYYKFDKKRKLSPLQKKYVKKVSPRGKLQKRYFQPWKYKKDISLLEKIQEEYNYLSNFEKLRLKDLKIRKKELQEKQKSLQEERHKIYNQRYKWKKDFFLINQIENVKGLQKEELILDIEIGSGKKVKELQELQEKIQLDLDSIKEENKKIQSEINIISRILNRNLKTLKKNEKSL